MSLEYEDLTMEYGCLDCEHEWLAYPKTGSELDMSCPNCESHTVWEQREISREEEECMLNCYPYPSIVPDFLTK